MGRGPGPLQKDILRHLHEAPGGRLSWEDLKSRFRREVADRSFHRAVRTLKKRGEIVDEEVRGERHVALAFHDSPENRELLALTSRITRGFAALARSRGLTEEQVESVLSGEDVDVYKPRAFLNE